MLASGSPAVYPLSDEDLEENLCRYCNKYEFNDSIQIQFVNLKMLKVISPKHTTDGDLEYTTLLDEGYNASLGKKTGEAELVPTRFGYFIILGQKSVQLLTLLTDGLILVRY